MKAKYTKAAFLAAFLSFCLLKTGYAFQVPPADTITVKFGNESKIIIYVSDKMDLEALSKYDLNAMLKDLKTEIEATEGDISYLKIEDQSGEHYLSDTATAITESLQSSKIEKGNQDSIPDNEGSLQKSIVIEAPGFKTKDRVKSKHSFNVELGVNNYFKGGDFSGTTSEKYAVKPFGSWYIGITSKRKSQIKGAFFLEWGGGISWYNFKLEDPQVRIVKGEEGVLFEDVASEINGEKSKLTASFINLSIVPLLDFSQGRRKESLSISEGPVKITKYNKQGFRIGVGPYAGYRLGSHTKFKYEQNGDTEKDKDRGSFSLNNFRYGVRFQIGYKGLDLFANYDLNPLFEKNHGPELNAFSFGIVL